ncbi:MAG: hypothetical protein J5J00_14050 [Deltaproteobacteria bacterium]|nr:hypothetical protein [Deltaproteobacteria bacterium]
MKILVVSVIVGLAAFSAVPCSAEIKKDNAEWKDSVRSKAEEMQRAFLTGDLESFIKYTYPPVIEKMGGKEKLLTAMHQSLREMKLRGITLSSVVASPPAEVHAGGDKLFALVPVSIELKVKSETVTHHGYNLGISDDGGTNWTFVDTVRARSPDFRQMLPDLPESLTIPIAPPSTNSGLE